MLHTHLPIPGTPATFWDGGIRKPRIIAGEVIAHDEDGCLVRWPKLVWHHAKGVTTHHTRLYEPWYRVG